MIEQSEIAIKLQLAYLRSAIRYKMTQLNISHLLGFNIDNDQFDVLMDNDIVDSAMIPVLEKTLCTIIDHYKADYEMMQHMCVEAHTVLSNVRDLYIKKCQKHALSSTNGTIAERVDSFLNHGLINIPSTYIHPYTIFKELNELVVIVNSMLNDLDYHFPNMKNGANASNYDMGNKPTGVNAPNVVTLFNNSKTNPNEE